MVTITSGASGPVVIEVRRSVELADVDEMLEVVAKRISSERQGLVLVELADIDYDEFEPDDIWIELKRGVFLKGMFRLAVVTDAEHTAHYEKFTFLAPFATKVFATAERQVAQDWLAAARADASSN